MAKKPKDARYLDDNNVIHNPTRRDLKTIGSKIFDSDEPDGFVVVDTTLAAYYESRFPEAIGSTEPLKSNGAQKKVVLDPDKLKQSQESGEMIKDYLANADTSIAKQPPITDRTTLNIYQRMNKIMSELDKIEKTGRNTSQNYSFIEQGAVVAAIREKLEFYGVRIRQSFMGHQVIPKQSKDGKISYKIVAKFRFFVINVDDPKDCYEAIWYSEGDDSLDKGTNKAATAAEKYFLMKELKITDQNDPDAEAGEHGRGKPEPLPYGLKRRQPYEPMNDEEKKVIAGLLNKLGIPFAEMPAAIRTNGADPENMTHDSVLRLIQKLNNNPVVPSPPPPEFPPILNPNDISNSPEAVQDLIDGVDDIPLPEVVIDDEFKNKLGELYESIGLNTWGAQWFFRAATGKPFATWDKLNDSEYRKAYDLIMDIIEEKRQVPHRFKVVAGSKEDTPAPTLPLDPSEPMSEQV